MSFVSLNFFILITIALPLYYSIKRSMLGTKLLFMILNGIFFLSFAQSLKSILPLLVFLACGYIGTLILKKFPNTLLMWLLILFYVFSFLYLKRYVFLDFIPIWESSFLVIGISYMLFRIVQLNIDVRFNTIEGDVSLLDYFNFTCFFLCIASGPIQRYQDFEDQQKAQLEYQLDEKEVFDAFSRIITGYLKVVFIAGFFSSDIHQLGYAINIMDIQRSPFLTLGWYLFSVTSITFYVYFNFSGYMDIVIGLGKLFCFKLPENFNEPFRSKNYIEFWARWHITLGLWLKTYVFNTILKVLISRWGSKTATPYLAVIAFFVCFFLMGLWHGATSIFFLYALFQGFGVSGNKLYQVNMDKYFGKSRYKKLKENVFYDFICRGATFSYLAISMTCLWGTFGDLLTLFGDSVYSIMGNLFLGFFVLTLISSILMFMFEMVLKWMLLLSSPFEKIIDTLLFRNTYLGAKFYFLAYCLLINVGAPPAFVYQEF
ncbi:MAG: hypothetical protein COA79_17155 [Planctomycetota bacterium]|nr:MAG: hypothetical protein COA79_17155 [Planctomycetota bacterium]